MKKIIALFAVLSICVLMLTACDGSNTTGEDSNITDREIDTSIDVVASYASIEEFIKAKDTFDHEGKPIDGKDTNTYAFLSSIYSENENGFYFDTETSDGSINIIMASSENAIYTNMTYGDDVITSVINLEEKKMYMFEPDLKIAVSMDISDEEIAEYTKPFSIADMFGKQFDTKASDLPDMVRYNVDIGGEIHTFEMTDGDGFLFDSSGRLRTLLSKNASADNTTYIFNEFSLNIPDGIFDIPSDYEIVDKDALRQYLQK